MKYKKPSKGHQLTVRQLDAIEDDFREFQEHFDDVQTQFDYGWGTSYGWGTRLDVKFNKLIEHSLPKDIRKQLRDSYNQLNNSLMELQSLNRKLSRWLDNQ